jgi:hypothetical protein
MKRILIIALLLLMRPVSLNSCGWDWNAEQYRFWLLQPEIGGSAAPARLLLHHGTAVLRSGLRMTIATLPFEANIAEWQAVVGTRGACG